MKSVRRYIKHWKEPTPTSLSTKYIVREQRAFFFRKTTVQVAGFGGKFVFE